MTARACGDGDRGGGDKARCKAARPRSASLISTRDCIGVGVAVLVRACLVGDLALLAGPFAHDDDADADEAVADDGGLLSLCLHSTRSFRWPSCGDAAGDAFGDPDGFGIR